MRFGGPGEAQGRNGFMHAGDEGEVQSGKRVRLTFTKSH